jgi:hypothetical protein
MLDERMNEKPMEPMEARVLDARIVRALEKSSDVASLIPESFSARVAGRVRVRRTIALKPTHYGRNAMVLSVAILLVVLVMLALGGRDRSTLGVVVDWCLCAQLIALAMWLSVKRRGLG